jgi:hypothetical protein
MPINLLEVKWRDCVTDPSPVFKKVLCFRNGDLYVAMRIDEYYLPIPFSDHYFCKSLSKPQKWHQIPFPDGFTGETKISVTANLNNVITMEECEKLHPKLYREFANVMIASIGTLQKPEGMKDVDL